MKICVKCGDAKPVTEFHRDANRRDGLRGHCKACEKVLHAAWAKANSERLKGYWADYRSVNREKISTRDAAYYVANSEKRKANAVMWSADNPDASRIHEQNRRARNRENGGILSTDLAERLFKLQRGKCACCALPLGDDYHLDHVMPIKLGGANMDNNIQLLRATCNSQKHAKHPVDFMQQRGFLL